VQHFSRCHRAHPVAHQHKRLRADQPRGIQRAVRMSGRFNGRIHVSGHQRFNATRMLANGFPASQRPARSPNCSFRELTRFQDTYSVPANWEGSAVTWPRRSVYRFFSELNTHDVLIGALLTRHPWQAKD
jgi:hypothetical protein